MFPPFVASVVESVSQKTSDAPWPHELLDVSSFTSNSGASRVGDAAFLTVSISDVKSLSGAEALNLARMSPRLHAKSSAF